METINVVSQDDSAAPDNSAASQSTSIRDKVPVVPSTSGQPVTREQSPATPSSHIDNFLPDDSATSQNTYIPDKGPGTPSTSQQLYLPDVTPATPHPVFRHTYFHLAKVPGHHQVVKK